ncbi:MAG: orotidine-5'-phosphate decarboxylase [Pseudomonadales bacterium]|jgi:orotidine-5'-phosphate decarboxylase|nr:orotidine-5'-phosphate decarboxylase [Pseudomonadales bacterium]
MDFSERLARAWATHDSMLCAGLDPDPDRFPPAVGRDRDAIAPFLEAIVAATADLVCAYKPQIAHFAAVGAEGALEQVIAAIRREAPHALVILDAKRGDIGSTAEMYAREAFDRYGADAVTVNPYLGSDGVAPFVARSDRGAVILCRTSNASGRELQDVPEDRPLFERVARLASERWNDRRNVMLVAGATQPQELARIRELAPGLPLLVPGIGAQGGDVDAVVAAGRDASGGGLVVSSSRAILYASDGSDFAAAARAEAQRTRDALRRAHDAGR